MFRLVFFPTRRRGENPLFPKYLVTDDHPLIQLIQQLLKYFLHTNRHDEPKMIVK
jgi:hypothetical protein